MNRNNSSDDFFGSDNEDGDYSLNNDLNRTVQRISPIGYSDGLEIGKEKTLQRGFNEGFKQASEQSYKWSLLLGLVSSVDVFFHHNKQFANGKDTSVLGDLVDKINKVIKEQCSSPTIEELKAQFFNFKDERTTTTTTNTTSTSENESIDSCCKSNNIQKDKCCGDEGTCKTDNKSNMANDNCCGGDNKGSCDSNKTNEEDSGCCGGSGNDEGCCKSNKTNENELKEFKFVIEMGGQLFEDLSKECVSTISSFGLDGQNMLDNCLAKKFRVTIN
ncbi:hypothetical protein DICPUDRAFT_28038 [Dictyostelium purpureum]|uniref:Essential protein Yae1 N-terminal domain-containing protein n=1 Tax=Dictyostelium purpureum TaxID=5786 RepID=F0ZB18_DICPU|nr:uncharacterized protein DICPUDRAFT_28038 [Dictyostelium purpureum]EGC38816.1 hypothetical protein DICPUDRAFT_28038 [Dictyostelium purpureum]|eukprot:XP_003284610.1 hypothetical protein DICPUDRAFT_28038 [Dictyostelium purpureum]